jgi:hypothetical protein
MASRLPMVCGGGSCGGAHKLLQLPRDQAEMGVRLGCSLDNTTELLRKSLCVSPGAYVQFLGSVSRDNLRLLLDLDHTIFGIFFHHHCDSWLNHEHWLNRQMISSKRYHVICDSQWERLQQLLDRPIIDPFCI